MRLTVDIEYSNLKFLFGFSPDRATPMVLPAGACPLINAPNRVGGDAEGVPVSLHDLEGTSHQNVADGDWRSEILRWWGIVLS